MFIILLATSVKEGIEDLQRYRNDHIENGKHVTVVRFENDIAIESIIESQFILAGDIIKLSGKSAVPADLLLIMTSNFEEGNQCYIETANIDGETNLKVREAPAGLSDLCEDGKPKLSLFNGTIEYEPPNKDIHTFIGALSLQSISEPISLDKQNILLRGSLFSNTEWAYGIALYTGQETKLQMNSIHAASKMSKMEQYLNKAIMIIFCAQFIMTTISVISIYMLGFGDLGKLPYIFPGGVDSRGTLPLWLSQW